MKVSKHTLKKSIAMLSIFSMVVATFVIGGTSKQVKASSSNALIRNSTFDSNTDKWGIYLGGGADATLSNDNGQLAVNISDVGTLNYGVQAYHDVIPLYKNGKYKLSFDISSTINRPVECMIQQNGGTYTSYAYMALDLTSETQHVSKTFTMEYDTDLFTKLVFNCGNQGEDLQEHSIYLDNVYLELTDDSAVDYSTTEKKESDIIINQIGYLPSSQKLAVFRNVTTDTTFSVINSETNKSVYTGKLTNQFNNSSANETDWYGDFSSLTTPGTYYITTDNLEQSFNFTISDNAYNSVLNDTVRMLYLQRCGCEVKDSQLNHPACHTSLATVYGTNEKIDVSGGWHDAGDYGRYVVAASKAVADLLLAYNVNPSLYGDNSNIPESGNNIPDILDEVRYELEWMLKMQNASNGGVYHKVTCADFPGYVMPQEETNPLIVTPISTTATADFSASMAMAYSCYKNIDAAFANKCLTASKLAYKFLDSNPNLIFTEASGVTTGAYGDKDDKDERYWAAAELYKATNDSKYHSDFVNSKIYTGLDWSTVGDYGNIAYLSLPSDKVDASKYASVKSSVLSSADSMISASNNHGYNISLDTYYWGSNMSIANNGIMLYVADSISNSTKYSQCADEHLNYLLGKNPLSTCFVTGYGSVSPENPHHRPSMALGEAVRGMLVGGVDEFLDDSVALGVLSDAPRAKCYIDHSESYSTNEVTIYWNSPLVYLLSYVMPDDNTTTDTPATETPVSTAPVTETPVTETPVTETPTPSDVTDVNISLNYVNDWGAGCVGEITILNNSSSIADWTLEFDYNRDISNLWNATLVSHVGNHYIIKCTPWASTLNKNSSVTIGFQGGTGSTSDILNNIKFY